MHGLAAIGVCAGLLVACGGSESVNLEQPADGGSDAPFVDGGGGIELPPDGESLCPKGACNYQTQAGCSGAQACQPAFSADSVTPTCAAPGTVPIGGACKAVGDCAKGGFCADGQCRTLCCGADYSACPDGESCIRQLSFNGSNGPVSAGVDLCFPVGTCKLFEANACGDKRACQIVDGRGKVACAPVGAGDQGAACSPQAPCIEGFSCVGGKCTRLCKAVASGGEPTCDEGEGRCIHSDRDPPGVGECTP